MNRSYFAKYRRAVMGMLLISVAGVVQADDTEIFFQSGVTGSDASTIPQVMFNMEYTPNMGSTVCTGVTWANFQTQCPEIYPIRHYLSPNDMPAVGDADYDVGRTLDQFQLTRAALKRVLAALGDLQVGMMLPHDDTNKCAGPDSGACSAGGYIFQRMVFLEKPYAGFDPANPDLDLLYANDPAKKEFFQRLDALPSPGGNLSHSQQHKEVYFELFRYLTGQKIYNGHNGWVNYNTNTDFNVGGWEYLTTAPNNTNQALPFRCITAGTCGDDVTGPLPGGRYSKSGGVVQDYRYNGDFVAIGNPVTHYISSHPFKWDSKAEDGLHYLSPLEDCVRVFVINVLDGGGTAQNDADDDIKKTLAEGGMGFTPSNNDPGFVQMVRWLHDKDLADGTITSGAGVLDLLDKQNVTSYFIANQPQQLDAAAVAGGTGAAIRLTDDAEAVVAAIEKIFSDILAVSSTFLAASIPVSSFDRGDMMDSTFMGVFQTDEDAKPFWPGNIKKVKLDTYEICVELDELSGACNKFEKRLQLVDVSGEPAFSPVDELIRKDALTFWTNKQGFDLYDNIDEDNEQAGFDGRAVYRGGAGQQIPGFLNASNNLGVVTWSNSQGGRQLYTNTDSGLIPLEWDYVAQLWPYIYTEENKAYWPTTYDIDGVLTPMTGDWNTDAWLYTQDPTLGVGGCRTSFYSGASGYTTCWSTDTYQIYDLTSNIIAYMRGFDVIDENLDGVVWQSRRWLMGDILHSRPTPLNYGAPVSSGYDIVENPDIRVVFGSNDGYLRMLRNTEGDTDATESGEELWAFMPREVMGSQIQLMYNAAGGDPIHPYGADGPVSFYVVDQDGTIDSTDGDQVLVTFGLRRGGRAVYGMDLTDPDSPSLLWSHDASSAGFEEMGYTFSQPVMRVLRWKDTEDPEASALRPVVVFAAGYDRDNKDTFGTVEAGSNDTMGNAIYIVDAQNGDLLWKVTGDADAICGSNCVYDAEMTDSIPSDVAAIPDRTGSLYRIYVGDTGGNVWRVDLTDGVDHTRSSPEVADWTAHRILELGRHAVADTDKLDNDRRFFHAPDIVSARDEVGRYIAVVIGSGNRAHPLQTHTTDGLFMYKDRGPVDSDWPLTRNDLMNLTSNCLQEYGATCNAAEGEDIDLLVNGWKIYFLTDEEAKKGEKSLGTALTLMNVVYFSTYVPAGVEDTSDMVCGPALGGSYEYAISLSNAGAMFDFDSTNNRTETDGEGNEVDVTLEKSDRRKRSPRPGLPVPPVLVSYDGVISVLTSAGMQYVGEADLMSTYWFEQNR